MLPLKIATYIGTSKKHIHIFLAPVKLALKKDKPGALQPMDFEKEEVFGAVKLEDFTWPRLLDSYSCIMCNRCQDVCPATNTGKALSPAAILINERYEQDGALALAVGLLANESFKTGRFHHVTELAFPI